jgi:DNA-binding response OmpR family regulator
LQIPNLEDGLEGRVLIVEDHRGNRQLIKERLEAEGLVVTEAATGQEGLESALRSIPQVILLSTSLPDLSGLDVTRRLREITRTQHTFVMLLGDEDNRAERLEGLGAGANDFVTHPIDVELVMLRVRNAIQRANQTNQTDPVTGMPAGRSVQAQLMRLIRDPEGSWELMRFQVRHLVPFREAYGFMAGDDLLRMTARIIAAALGRDDVEDDFLGYGGQHDFIVVTTPDRAAKLTAEVVAQFDEGIGSHYDMPDRERYSLDRQGETHALASLDVHRVTPEDGPFYDIRSLSEALSG